MVTYVFSDDTFVFSEDDVFSYKVVDLRGMRPAVRLLFVVVPSNLLIAARGLAGEDKDAKIENFIKLNHNHIFSKSLSYWFQHSI